MAAPGNQRAICAFFAEVHARHRDEPEWVASIIVPTLLLWGGDDTWVPVALSGRSLSDVPHARRIVYPGVGHVAMEEIPARSVRDVLAFLEMIEHQVRN